MCYGVCSASPSDDLRTISLLPAYFKFTTHNAYEVCPSTIKKKRRKGKKKALADEIGFSSLSHRISTPISLKGWSNEAPHGRGGWYKMHEFIMTQISRKEIRLHGHHR